MKTTHAKSRGDKDDIRHVRRRLDEFYSAAVRNLYPLETVRRDVPAAMVASKPDDRDMVVWKMLPSTIDDETIRDLEARLGHPLPPMYRAYLKSRFHLFRHLAPYEIIDNFNGRRASHVGIATMPCDNPLRTFHNAGSLAMVIERSRTEHPLSQLANQFENRLFQLGYLLIGWNIDERLALDTHFPNSEGDYEVVILSHSLQWECGSLSDVAALDLYDVSRHTWSLCSSFREFVDLYIRYPSSKDTP